MDDQRPGSVLSLEDSASFDELEGAAALPRETEVRTVEWLEDGRRQSETTAGFGTRSHHREIRRSRSQSRRRYTSRDQRDQFHGPWCYGKYEWRCEVAQCRLQEPFPSFNSLEKHFQRIHSEKRIEYVCVFQGPTCYRSHKHDLVREHCRSSFKHKRISRAERTARTERMPWITAINPDYIPARNIPPLPKNPEGGQTLEVDPKVLPFAAKASPVNDPTEKKRPRCMMMHHDGTYAAVRQPNRDVPRETLTQPVSRQTCQPVEAEVFTSRDIRRGVISSRTAPAAPAQQTEQVSRVTRPLPTVLKTYQEGESRLRAELVEVRQQIDLLRAREAVLKNQQERLWEEHHKILLEHLNYSPE